MNFVDPLGLAITDKDIAAYNSGLMSQADWELLNKADQMWNSALEDDYSSKAVAHAMTVRVRQSYDPNYYDDFDYTFGTGEMAVDYGELGNYMKTLAVINDDGSGGILRISYSRVERNGHLYLKLNNVRARSFSGRRRTKTGINGYMGQTNTLGLADTADFWSNDSYIFERAYFDIIPDDQGAYLQMGANAEFYFGSSSVWISLNVYGSNYTDLYGKFHDDERFISSPGMSGENWMQHPKPPKT